MPAASLRLGPAQGQGGCLRKTSCYAQRSRLGDRFFTSVGDPENPLHLIISPLRGPAWCKRTQADKGPDARQATERGAEL